MIDLADELVLLLGPLGDEHLELLVLLARRRHELDLRQDESEARWQCQARAIAVTTSNRRAKRQIICAHHHGPDMDEMRHAAGDDEGDEQHPQPRIGDVVLAIAQHDRHRRRS